MAETVAVEEPGGQAATVVVRRDWGRRLLNELLALFIALLVLLAGALILLDTAPGHRFVVDRLARVETSSGLKFRIGRIEGSLFGKSVLRGVAVSDQRGVFLTSPRITLDWTPASWLSNRLSIDSLTAERVDLIRRPALKPSTRKGPILPGFDIHIGELRIDRLNIGQGVAGQPRSGRLQGKADIRSGRAVAELYALLDKGGDRIAFKLDAEPDRNRFDIDARVRAPGNGLVPALLGTRRSVALDIHGAGTWAHWRGQAALDLASRPAFRINLGVDRGRYQIAGHWAPAQFLKGRFHRLTQPVVTIRGDATLANRVLNGELFVGSPEIRVATRGKLDLANNSFVGVRVGADLIKPPALFTNMSGRNVRLALTLDGPFATADYSYRLTSDGVKFDDTGFVALRAEGRGKLSTWPMRVPVRLSARAITGVGDVAGAILANPKIEGWLEVTPKLVRGDKLKLTSARINGQISLLIDLVTGRFEVLLSGSMHRYLIPGLGIVDVMTDLRVVPGPDGHHSHVTGTAKAWVRRLDNSFFRDLTGGLPNLTTNLERGADGIVHFTNLQLYSPKLRLSGAGYRNRDGTFHITAAGRQAKYGPLKLVLDDHIERPRVDLLLASPNQALGITNMHLLLEPTAAGFDYRASGGSKLGPFTSSGQILLPHNQPTVIAIAALDAGGAHASGRLRSDPGGFTGQLALSGGTLQGTLGFSPVNGAQRIEAHLTASGASFPTFAVRSGRVDGTIILDDAHTTVDGVVNGKGIEVGGLTLANLTANARLIDGSGQVRAAFAGRRGAAFSFTTLADVSPDRISLTGNGRIEHTPLVLTSPAVLTREGDGWALAPTALTFDGGQATVSGRSGSRPEVHAAVSSMPMGVLDLFWPNLDLSGIATGKLDYAWKGNRAGRLDLKVRGLGRSGLVLASKPVDVAVAAVVSGGNAALRAVAGSGGTVLGRAQARFSPMGGGPLVVELMNAPMFAQLRYAGPADTLWRLSGNEFMDLSGPVAIGTDVSGRLSDPRIIGSIRASNARLESAVTGMVIEGLSADARFTGPRLDFTRLSGTTPGGGSVSGAGSVTFSGGRTALDLSFNATQALLLNRDDIAARVSGPLTIRSNGQGGTIGGKLHLDKGLFRLGKASAAAIPKLSVRDVGLDEADVILLSDLHPWRLDLAIDGNNLNVTGLGISSRWRTNLKVGGFADSPAFTGRAELVRGDYDFAGRNFKLDRGTIRFAGESPPNPQLDIHAIAQVQGLDASVNVKGTGLQPEISFSSTPPLPQDELLSRILFGTSITNLSAPEALQLASAVAALQSGSGSLDPINALRKAVGLDRLRVVPADVATGQKTAIAAGKYITRKLFVEVVTDGQGYSATRVEYQITRWLSILSTVSTVGRSSAALRVSKDY